MLLRVVGWFAMATVLLSTLFTDPKPSLHGAGPFVALGFLVMTGGLILAARRAEWWPGARFLGLSLVGASALLFAAIQPESAGYAGIYFVMAIGGIRLADGAALII